MFFWVNLTRNTPPGKHYEQLYWVHRYILHQVSLIDCSASCGKQHETLTGFGEIRSWGKWNPNTIIFMKENALENIVCKMVVNLLRTQNVNTVAPITWGPPLQYWIQSRSNGKIISLDGTLWFDPMGLWQSHAAHVPQNWPCGSPVMGWSWWRHQMETFSRYWPFVRGIHWSPMDSLYKGQWCGALMFSLMCAWTNDWANSPDAGDLRRHGTHYDVIVMYSWLMHGILQGDEAQSDKMTNSTEYANFLPVVKTQRPSNKPSKITIFLCVLTNWMRPACIPSFFVH